MHLRWLWWSLAVTAALAPSSARAADFRLPVGGRVTIEFLRSSTQQQDTLTLIGSRSAVALAGCSTDKVHAPGTPLVTVRSTQEGCRIALDGDPDAPGI